MEKVKLNSPKWLSLEDINGERWKKIKGFDFYAISNYGRLKSLAHNTLRSDGKKLNLKDKIVKLALNKHGYPTYRLTKDGKLYTCLIHRLVALTFIPNPLNLPIINHKDENRANNNIENLEWCTYKYNSNYGTAQERHSSSLRNILYEKSIPIDQYNLKGEYIKTLVGKREIIAAGYRYETVRRCCLHQQKTASGFVWRFYNENFYYTEDNRNDDCCKKAVICYDLHMNKICEYKGITDASMAIVGNKKGNSAISCCCNGGRTTAFGFIWKHKKG